MRESLDVVVDDVEIDFDPSGRSDRRKSAGVGEHVRRSGDSENHDRLETFSSKVAMRASAKRSPA